MNRQLICLFMAVMAYLPACFAVKPDSVYLFAYGIEKNNYHNGLHFAWSLDRKSWHAIGPEHSFLRSDYGRWGSQKKMYSPFLFRDPQGQWHCVWGLNETDGAIGYASSDDLVYWGRQSYPLLVTGDNVLRPEVQPVAGLGATGSNAANSGTKGSGTTNPGIKVIWASGSGNLFEAFTPDFQQYSSPERAQNFVSSRETVRVAGVEQNGTVHRVSRSLLEGLLTARQIAEAKQAANGERLAMNEELFKEPVSVSIGTEKRNQKAISDMLIGVFFEDINYAADGGLYAELVQNRDFEYSLSDKEGNDKTWNSFKAWSTGSDDLSFTVDSVKPIHPNNRHYARLQVKKQGSGLVNEGFDGISLARGEKYDFSVFARSPEARRGALKIRLTGHSGEVYGEAVTGKATGSWQKLSAVITATETVNGARLEVIPLQTGTVELDMISLFPQKTFKGRKNGLRADL
ncbi:MAG: carbohydrate binding domain-containing protein, partial [Leadbetterella sp.]|nr:carbohydrate binding domain-containing protein [Leadbetterella sp.]